MYPILSRFQLENLANTRQFVGQANDRGAVSLERLVIL
jgi:hypothetical protein